MIMHHVKLADFQLRLKTLEVTIIGVSILIDILDLSGCYCSGLHSVKRNAYSKNYFLMLLLVKVLEPLLNDGFYKNQILVL